ncbi:BolA family transcriptional regulator [Mitsuaria sp. GD03876]|uniref:BolA family protein n=1 Tax=Mitsuaria sp. GD03876 TaxID=2975399 RepID=UPI002449C8D7|nr:BolA family transcriptional regulator [Mitsuaria sp. GD03876]MDH0864312.1 BolA family transcriptional regulator [Mitsuaria sp. GD03876]
MSGHGTPSGKTNPAATPSAAIEARLQAALEPVSLRLRDDSAHHAGHAGAREGGHYYLEIVSPRFAGLPRVARHRLVYDALADLMQKGIHALAIDARAPDEQQNSGPQ